MSDWIVANFGFLNIVILIICFFLGYVVAVWIERYTARRCAAIVAVVHGCGVAYNRILREFGLSANEG